MVISQNELKLLGSVEKMNHLKGKRRTIISDIIILFANFGGNPEFYHTLLRPLLKLDYVNLVVSDMCLSEIIDK